ncbi:hypothetical protein KO528_00080 [Saccharophagus degradans]|uniref:hypothetical protein n=1 Tax=Saccharophagus degradans TaxID=86304 RepID=UPI001C07FDF1|nr:hypothetical protein [Saccharophagus degradans]MBU2983732.1 hypothetical protein [Saccharophagus degradans]
MAFNQSNPDKLVDHGERGNNQIERLLNNSVLYQQDILLTVEAPNSANDDIQEACTLTYNAFAEQNVQLVVN